MKISIEHFSGKYPQFNVNLASSEGKEPFLTIKGCRIVEGTDGQFVSWPATKKDDGKYWKHVWGSESFAAAVLAEAKKGAQKPAAPVRKPFNPDADVPF